MKDGKINVLIFPCETNSNELHDALSYCFNINVYGASSVQRHGKYIYSNYNCELPLCSSLNFLQVFNEYIDEQQIDLIFTSHDSIALYLAEHANEIHAQVVQKDVQTVRICRSKILTHDTFYDCEFVPKRYTTIEEVVFPAFVKPDEGEGGHGAFVCMETAQLSTLDFHDFLITEYLPGTEYTVDCFTDKNGALSYVSPRTRERTFGGITSAGRTIPVTDEIRYIAECINNRLSFLGLWYFQLREDKDGHLKLMEISVRCAGTMCMTRAKGVNLPLLTVYAALGYDTTIYDNGYQVLCDRSLISRYDMHIDYTDVYIDFDDTITLRGEVNTLAMFFLYQCQNKGKKVHLLTRHIYNIHNTLQKYAISENLFEDIIAVAENESKSKYINVESAIFIDNMFKERTEVHNLLGLPVFDADAFEFLLDWRV